MLRAAGEFGRRFGEGHLLDQVDAIAIRAACAGAPKGLYPDTG
jgi:hypothetical protein